MHRAHVSLLVVALLAVVCVSTVQASPFSLCPGSPTDFDFQNVTYTPNPPQKGQPVQLYVGGNIDEQINDGAQVTITVFFNGIQLYSNTVDWGQGTNLPAGPGEINYQYEINIPSIAPSGSYQVNVDFVDDNYNDVGCLSISFNLGK